MKNLIIVITVGMFFLQGCATKNYGRQGILSSYEQETMTCREIDLELAKMQGFIEYVNKESKFSGKDVLAILGDLGIGNYMEKEDAIESANNRIAELNALKNRKQCATNLSQQEEEQHLLWHYF